MHMNMAIRVRTWEILNHKNQGEYELFPFASLLQDVEAAAQAKKPNKKEKTASKVCLL